MGVSGPWEKEMADSDAVGDTVIGTPDDLVASIRQMQEITGGLGCVIGFANDWANREGQFRSWELVARYVVPEVNGLLENFRESQRYTIEHREPFKRAGAAIVSKIMDNERAAKALQQTTAAAKAAMPAHHAPDLTQAKES